MRPRQKLVKHNLNVRKNVYGRPRQTTRHFEIKEVGTRMIVSEELIERYGKESIKNEMIKELAQKLLESGMVQFLETEGHLPNTRSITARVNLVKNG